MNMKIGISDQRSKIRLPIGEGVVVWKNGKCNLGSILDISDHGVSFVYIAENGSEADSSDKVDIYFLGGKYTITGIKISLVSDIVLSSAKPYSMLSKRRRSVKFLNLTDQQRHLLGDVTSGLFLNSLAIRSSIS